MKCVIVKLAPSLFLANICLCAAVLWLVLVEVFGINKHLVETKHHVNEPHLPTVWDPCCCIYPCLHRCPSVFKLPSNVYLLVAMLKKNLFLQACLFCSHLQITTMEHCTDLLSSELAIISLMHERWTCTICIYLLSKSLTIETNSLSHWNGTAAVHTASLQSKMTYS